MSKYIVLILLFLSVCIPAYSEEEKKEPVYEGKKLSKWMEQLKSPDAWSRWYAVRAIYHIGNKQIAPALKVLLEDEDSLVRVNAAAALMKFGDECGRPVLMVALKDADLQTRVDAAVLLSEMGDKWGLTVLIEALKSNEPVQSHRMDRRCSDIRYKAVIALGNIGDNNAVPALIEFIKDYPTGHPDLITALVKIGDERAIPALISMLSAKSPRNWENDRRVYTKGGAVVYGLVRFGKAAIPELLKGLQHDDLHVRAKCAEALGIVGSEDEAPALIKCLTDKEHYVCEAVALALCRMGDKRAVEPLIELLKGEKGRVYDYVIPALTNIGDKRAAAPILELLKNKKYLKADFIYVPYINALGVFGDKSAVPVLISELKDNNFTFVNAAAMALAKIGDISAVPALIETLKERKSDVRYPAAQALGELGDKSAVPVLIDSLKKEDRWTRGESARALGKIGDKSAIPALEALLQDESIYVKIYAAEALCKLGEKKKGIPVLLDALSIKKNQGEYEYPCLESAAALYKVGDERGLKKLKEAMEWPEKSGGYEARTIFCQVADKSEVPILIEIYKTGSIMLAAAALDAMKRINDSNTIPLLLESLKGDGDDIRIFGALRILSRRNFGTDKERWQKWWEANKGRILKEEAEKEKGAKQVE